MITPVQWSQCSGEQLEHILAVLIAQTEPTVQRREPSSGDGGVDLHIKRNGTFEVIQVKGFHSRLTPGRKAQIKDSYETLRNNPRLSLPVSKYAVACPLDQTSGEQHWFDDLTAGAPFETNWLGKVQWDALAAKHPHVVTYYFHGEGAIRDRAMQLVANFVSPDQTLTANDVAARIGMEADYLSSNDPHYNYEILTSTRAHDTPDLKQGAVFMKGTQTAEGNFVTVVVRPSHRYSLEDRPIDGDFKVVIDNAEQATKFREAFRLHQDYGSVLEIPIGSMMGTLNAPGGLGGEFEGASGRIQSRDFADKLEACRMVLIDEREQVIAGLNLVTDMVTAGDRGAHVRYHDESDLFRWDGHIHWDRDDPGDLTVNYSIDRVRGKPIGDAIAAIRFLNAIPNAEKLEMRPRHGKKGIASAPIDKMATLDQDAITHLEDLNYIQDHADEPIEVPDEFDTASAEELHDYVRMLRGETINGTWSDITICLIAGFDRATFAKQFSSSVMIEESARQVFDIYGQEVDLGRFRTLFKSVRIADRQPDDERKVRCVPGNDTSFSRTQMANESASAPRRRSEPAATGVIAARPKSEGDRLPPADSLRAAASTRSADLSVP